jgi:hypothetical protein
LKQLGESILAAKYETKYSKYVFENPSEVTGREATVDEKWKLLDSLSKEKRNVLDDHLAREEFKEAVRTLNSNHVDKFNNIQGWVTDKENYLQRKEAINSVSEAETQLSLLESFEKEKQRTTNGAVTQLKHLGSEILAKHYKTSYSEWVFEHPEEIKTRESTVDAKFSNLSTLSEAKLKVLQADLAREIEKERLRLEYAHLASDFTRWVKDTSENLAVSHFGFLIEEVEAYQATLDKSNAEIQEQASAKKTASEAVHAKMTEMGVTENIYTSYGNILIYF